MNNPPTLLHPNCTLALIPIVDAQPARQLIPPQPEIDWGKWRNVDEAVMAATARYPTVRFDFTGAHLDAVDPTLRQFDKLAKEYPQVVDRLEYVGTYGGSGSPAASSSWGLNTYAHASVDGKRLGLNPHWYGNPQGFKTSLRQGEALNWHPKGNDSIASVLTHEFGHHVENWLRSVDGNISALDVVDMGGNGLVSTMFDRWFNRHSPRKQLSDYAMTNGTEAWAEAFAAQYHSPAKVKQYTYVKEQRELLAMLDPSKWRHEAGLEESIVKMEAALLELPADKRDLTERALEAARKRLATTPAGEWRWLRDLPADERPAAFERIQVWKREIGVP